MLKKSHNERNAVIEFVKQNQKTYNGSVFTFDRGYYSFFMENMLNQNNIYFIFRLSKSLHFIPEELRQKEEGDVIINEKNRRIIKYTIENKYYYILTNLLDNKKYPLDTIKTMYHNRWEIEGFFKISKSYLKLDHIKQKNEINIHHLIVISKLTYYLLF